jgi:hypothetical protein
MTESHQLRSAFLHIPKTAGTSIRNALQRVLGTRLVVIEREENLFHRPYDDYGFDSMLFGHLSWRMCAAFAVDTYFTVLREPIERCISQVEDWLNRHGDALETNDHGRLCRVVIPERGLIWNLQSLMDRPDIPQYRALNNAQVHQIAGHHIDRRLSPCPDILSRARANLAACTVVGCTRDLSAFASGLSDWVGQTIEIRADNASLRPAREVAECLPAAVRARLEQLNELDLLLHAEAVAYGGKILNNGASNSIGGENVGISLRAGLPRVVDCAPVLALQGRLRGRVCHHLVDISEAQGRFGVAGGIFADRAISGREAALLTLLIQPDEQITTTAPTDGNFLLFDVADPLFFAHAASDSDIPLRLALLQGMASTHIVQSLFDHVARRLVPYGVILLLDAAHSTNRDGIVALATLERSYGISVFASIDTHLLLCHRNWGWFWRVHLRAKMGDLEMVRIRVDDADIIRVETNY